MIMIMIMNTNTKKIMIMISLKSKIFSIHDMSITRAHSGSYPS